MVRTLDGFAIVPRVLLEEDWPGRAGVRFTAIAAAALSPGPATPDIETALAGKRCVPSLGMYRRRAGNRRNDVNQGVDVVAQRLDVGH